MEKTFMLYSLLLRKDENAEEITPEDIKNMINVEVSDNGIKLYKKVIKLLSREKSYNEIYYLIDNYSESEFDTLLEDQKTYIKTRIKKDLEIRKIKER